MSSVGMTGTITLFDPDKKVGVISPTRTVREGSEWPGDLFFQVQNDDDVRRYHQGQLVQFVADKEDSEWLVHDIQVLSEKS